MTASLTMISLYFVHVHSDQWNTLRLRLRLSVAVWPWKLKNGNPAIQITKKKYFFWTSERVATAQKVASMRRLQICCRFFLAIKKPEIQCDFSSSRTLTTTWPWRRCSCSSISRRRSSGTSSRRTTTPSSTLTAGSRSLQTSKSRPTPTTSLQVKRSRVAYTSNFFHGWEYIWAKSCPYMQPEYWDNFLPKYFAL